MLQYFSLIRVTMWFKWSLVLVLSVCSASSFLCRGLRNTVSVVQLLLFFAPKKHKLVCTCSNVKYILNHRPRYSRTCAFPMKKLSHRNCNWRCRCKASVASQSNRCLLDALKDLHIEWPGHWRQTEAILVTGVDVETFECCGVTDTGQTELTCALVVKVQSVECRVMRVATVWANSWRNCTKSKQCLSNFCNLMQCFSRGYR